MSRGWERGRVSPAGSVPARPSPICSPQSPDYLPEISQAHVSRCLEELQKSPCKELFSSCLQ